MKTTNNVARAIRKIVNTHEGSTRMQWIITLVVNLTSLSYGLQTSWPACVAKVLQSGTLTDSPLSDLDISWLASIPSLAALLCIPLWMYIVDNFGRKICLVLCAVLHFTYWLVTYFATNMTIFILTRIISGVAGSGGFYIISIYTKEISQDDLRGSLGLVSSNARNFGVFFIYLLGGYMGYYTIIYIALGLAVVSMLTVVVIPESPTFFIKTGCFEIAASTIAYIRNLKVDDTAVQNAVDSIKAEDDKFKSIPTVSCIGIFKQNAWCKGIIIMNLLMLCQGMHGGFAFINYAPTIVKMFQITVNPELQSLSVPVFMIIGSFVSMVLIERLGRKVILVTSSLLSTLAFAALAAIIIIQREGEVVPEWVVVVLIVTPVFACAAAVSPLPYIIMAEMFNFQIRAKVIGGLLMLGWGSNFIQLILFGYISDGFGLHVTFIFFCAVNLFGTFVALLLLPETRGKSVPEIEMELEKKLKW